jgi:hypothetical protein
MREEDLHYVGGVIDGDGSIQLRVGKQPGTDFGFQADAYIKVRQLAGINRNCQIHYNGNYKLHYIGGLFDCDSWITIEVSKSKSINIGYQASPKIGIEMKTTEDDNPTREIVEEIFKEAGSKPTSTVRERDGKSPTWVLQSNGRQALSVLELLKPYLRLKQDHAEAILSVDWDNVHSDKDTFIEAMEVRDEIRSDSKQESKYDAEYFREEFAPNSKSATDADW